LIDETREVRPERGQSRTLRIDNLALVVSRLRASHNFGSLGERARIGHGGEKLPSLTAIQSLFSFSVTATTARVEQKPDSHAHRVHARFEALLHAALTSTAQDQKTGSAKSRSPAAAKTSGDSPRSNASARLPDLMKLNLRTAESTSPASKPLLHSGASGFLTRLLVFVGVLNLTLAVQAGKTPVAPTAPSALRATPLSSSQIKLNWRDNSCNELGFIIQHSASMSGLWSQRATASKNIITYTDSGLTLGLTPSTTSYHRICAYNSRVASTNSLPALATLSTTTPCSYTLSGPSASPSYSVASGPFTVTTTTSCTWTPSSTATWLTCTPASGTGSGAVSWSVTANPITRARTGTLTIAGQSFNATQGAMPCTCSTSPTSYARNYNGGNGAVTVTPGACSPCSASSSAITTTSSGNGNDSGIAAYSVATNTTSSIRRGTMTIAGQTLTVTQDVAPAPCSYALSPSSAIPSYGAATSTLTATSDSTRSWTPSSSEPTWLTGLSGQRHWFRPRYLVSDSQHQQQRVTEAKCLMTQNRPERTPSRAAGLPRRRMRSWPISLRGTEQR